MSHTDCEASSQLVCGILGYIKVTPISDNCEKGVHYLLRVAGKITKVNEQTEDIAEGLINERKFIKINEFLGYCIKKVLNI